MIEMQSKVQRFQKDEAYRYHRIIHFSKKHAWILVKDNGETLKFVNKQYAIIKINYWNINIETSISHPTWGNTVLIRKGEFTEKLIESIFRNPRKHMPNTIKSEYL